MNSEKQFKIRKTLHVLVKEIKTLCFYHVLKLDPALTIDEIALGFQM